MSYSATQSKTLLVMIVLVFGVAAISRAQVSTGVPPYQSFGGGPDVINLGNLNVHYSIPVFSKAGRGMPFRYALAYDSSIWSPASGTWTPNSNWGLHRDTAALVGYVTLRTVTSTCKYGDGSTGDVFNWYFGPYVDQAGTSHSFSLHVNYRECNPGDTDTGTMVIGDGSGIKVDTAGSTAKLTLPSGDVITPLILSGGTSSGTGNSKDSNG